MRRMLLILACLFVFILSQTYTLRKHTEDLNLCEIKCPFREYCIQMQEK